MTWLNFDFYTERKLEKSRKLVYPLCDNLQSSFKEMKAWLQFFISSHVPVNRSTIKMKAAITGHHADTDKCKGLTKS